MPQMPTLPLLFGNVLQQKIDGVVGIGAIVHVLWRFFDVDVRAHLHKIAFRDIAAANVLVDEDVAGLFEFIRRP